MGAGVSKMSPAGQLRPSFEDAASDAATHLREAVVLQTACDDESDPEFQHDDATVTGSSNWKSPYPSFEAKYTLVSWPSVGSYANAAPNVVDAVVEDAPVQSTSAWTTAYWSGNPVGGSTCTCDRNLGEDDDGSLRRRRPRKVRVAPRSPPQQTAHAGVVRLEARSNAKFDSARLARDQHRKILREAQQVQPLRRLVFHAGHAVRLRDGGQIEDASAKEVVRKREPRLVVERRVVAVDAFHDVDGIVVVSEVLRVVVVDASDGTCASSRTMFAASDYQRRPLRARSTASACAAKYLTDSGSGTRVRLHLELGPEAVHLFRVEATQLVLELAERVVRRRVVGRRREHGRAVDVAGRKVELEEFVVPAVEIARVGTTPSGSSRKNQLEQASARISSNGLRLSFGFPLGGGYEPVSKSSAVALYGSSSDSR